MPSFCCLLLPFLSRSEEVLSLGIKRNSFKGKGIPVSSFLLGSRKGKGTKKKLQPSARGSVGSSSGQGGGPQDLAPDVLLPPAGTRVVRLALVLALPDRLEHLDYDV